MTAGRQPLKSIINRLHEQRRQHSRIYSGATPPRSRWSLPRLVNPGKTACIFCRRGTALRNFAISQPRSPYTVRNRLTSPQAGENMRMAEGKTATAWKLRPAVESDLPRLWIDQLCFAPELAYSQ